MFDRVVMDEVQVEVLGTLCFAQPTFIASMKHSSLARFNHLCSNPSRFDCRAAQPTSTAFHDQPWEVVNDARCAKRGQSSPGGGHADTRHETADG